MKKYLTGAFFCCLAVLVSATLVFAEDSIIIRFKNGQTQTIRLETVQGSEFSGGGAAGT